MIIQRILANAKVRKEYLSENFLTSSAAAEAEFSGTDVVCEVTVSHFEQSIGSDVYR